MATKRSKATNVQGIRERYRPDGTRRGFEVRYRDHEGRLRGRTFRTKDEAKRWQTDNDHAIQNRTYIAPEKERTPWQAVADEWLSVHGVNLRARTREGYEGILNRHLGAWTPRPINSIERADVRKVLDGLRSKGRAEETEHRVFNVISAVFRFAVEEGYIKASPADTIRKQLRSVARKEFRARPLTHAEAMTIINNLPAGRYRLFGLLGLWTGFRAGELTGLRVRNLDTLRLTVQADETVEDVGGVLSAGIPKTSKSRGRRVPIPKDVMDEVIAYVQLKRLGPDDYVFTNGEAFFHYQNFRNRQWLPACKAAGITVRFYDLRHSFASLRAQQGVPPHVLMDWMGHTSITTTMNIYAHVYEDDPTHREMIERLYSASATPTPTTNVIAMNEG